MLAASDCIPLALLWTIRPNERPAYIYNQKARRHNLHNLQLQLISYDTKSWLSAKNLESVARLSLKTDLTTYKDQHSRAPIYRPCETLACLTTSMDYHGLEGRGTDKVVCPTMRFKALYFKVLKGLPWLSHDLPSTGWPHRLKNINCRVCSGTTADLYRLTLS